MQIISKNCKIPLQRDWNYLRSEATVKKGYYVSPSIFVSYFLRKSTKWQTEIDIKMVNHNVTKRAIVIL